MRKWERREKRGGNVRKITLWPSMPSIKNKWPFEQKRLGTTGLITSTAAINRILYRPEGGCINCFLPCPTWPPWDCLTKTSNLEIFCWLKPTPSDYRTSVSWKWVRRNATFFMALMGTCKGDCWSGALQHTSCWHILGRCNIPSNDNNWARPARCLR